MLFYLAPFDEANVGAVHAGSVCKSLLGEASVLAAGSDSLTECDDGQDPSGPGVFVAT